LADGPFAGVPHTGAVLGRYLLGDVLGQGAMATVFRARDRQLKRTVAIKVMTLAVAARGDAAERFRREAQAVAALRHPGIVEIHDFVAAADGEPAYIVAELIDGPTLTTLLESRRGRLLPEVAALIGWQVAEALAAAHERGVVHRDVKPDNVMVEKTGEGSRVVITDFGVAHVTGMESMTATGALVGSPAYMSPEQARGAETGPAADVWAVGVLLYQMMTGILPFPGREPFAVIAAICRGEFRKPSQVQATVSPEMNDIVIRCMSPDPQRRTPSARVLADELRALAEQAQLGDGGQSLRRFLDDPEAFEAQLRPRVADAAVTRARQHVRRGELGRALSQVGRATAYVPDHRGAQAVLRSISARRRWARAAAMMLGLGALAGATYATWTVRTRRPPAHLEAVMPRLEPVPVERRPEPVLVEKKGEPAALPPKRRPKRMMTRAPQTEPAVVEAATAPVEVVAPPPPAPPPVLLGSVKLRATQAFCLPSLDDRPPKYSPAEYRDVTPGKHQVSCSLELNGPRIPVGEIEVGPGGSVDKQVARGPDGRPAGLH
jgi:hypothetical protein